MDASITRRDAILTGAGAALAVLGTAGPARAARRTAGLTPEQQAGQRVIFSYSGLTVPGALLDQIAAGEAAGVIFFGDNISDLDQIGGVVAQLRDAARDSPIAEPPLLMTDQEGGGYAAFPGTRSCPRSRSACRTTRSPPPPTRAPAPGGCWPASA